ncbi:YDG domain-containing protein [Flavobacterium luteum]|nr:YDG domain-containing protein [Flavobacterium luteum]
MINTLLNWKKTTPISLEKILPSLSIKSKVIDGYVVIKHMSTIIVLLALLFVSNDLFSQANNMANNTDFNATYGNQQMALAGSSTGTNNQIWTFRAKAKGTVVSGTYFYQFNDFNYNSNRVWNLNTPTYNTIATAIYGTGGYNGGIKMGATNVNNYYTFNIRKNLSTYSNSDMAILETTFNPTTITSYTTPSGIIASQTATVTVTLPSNLQTNEYLYLGWSTDNFATSGNSGIVSVATNPSTGNYTFTIPGAAASSIVSFYPFTSVSSSTPSYANAPLLTLNMRSSTGVNNAGVYSSYTVAGPTITLGTSSGTYNVAVNGTSTVQTSSVSGSNLTTDILATAPTSPAYYEVSSDGTTWGSTATFTQVGGNVSGTLSIRYKPTAVENAVAKNIVLTSTGATTKNYTATGTAPNSITVQFQIPGNWSGTTVKVYAFNGGTVNTVGFPGSDMTNVGGGWYSYQLTYTNANTSLLFDNGTSSYQTNDITGVSTSTCWNTTSGSSGVKYVVATTSCPSSSPSVTTPTVTSITNNSAVLGATITNQNASAVTDYGTVYNTSTGVTTQNKLSAGTNPGTVPPSFTYTHSRSLSAETQYFYKGYATNGSGDGLSLEGNFYTLSNPASGTSTVAVANPSSSTLDLSWTTATFPGSGAGTKGYILLRANSPTVPSLSNSNGAAPVAGAGTTIVSSTIFSPTTSFTVSSLAQSQTYNFVLIPFTANATSTAATYNYLTGFAPTASGTTLAGPAITSISGTISGGTGIYTGETITINGTNLSGATAVSFNGVAGTIVGTPGASSFQAKMLDGTNASGNISVTISGGPLTTAFIFLGYRTAAAGNWTTSGTWTGGILPSSSNRLITINDFVDITTDLSGTQTGAFTINATGKITFGVSGNLKIQTGNAFTNNGIVDMTSGGTFEFVGGATFTNNNTFTSGIGTVNFSGGSTTLAGTTAITFNNLFNSSSLSISKIPTIAGIFRINGGSVATANAIIYSPGSTLTYATGGNYTTGNEWKVGTTTGTAVPSNVTIISSIVNPTGNALTCPGTLTINNTGIFGMNNNSTPFTVTGDLIINSGGLFRYSFASTNSPLTVNGSIDIKSGGVLNLTNANSGCDMTVGGGFKNAGTFTHNNRRVTLNGSSAQVIDGGNWNNFDLVTNAFYDLTISNSNGGVSLGSAVCVTNSLTLSNGIVSTNSNLLRVTSTNSGAVSGFSGNSYINGSLQRALPGSLASGSTYVFPVGKLGGTNPGYYPMSLVNPITTSPVNLTAEAFNTTSNGVLGSGLFSISNTEYWSLASTGAFTSSTYSLQRVATNSNTFDAIARSANVSPASTFTSIGGTPSGTSINGSSSASGATQQYFAFARLSPVITLGSTPLAGFSTTQCINSTSSVQTFTVAGTSLNGDITLTPPANFEISKTSSSAGFVDSTGSITVSPTNSTVAPTTIFVRFKPTAAIAYSDNISVATANATTQNVAVSGTGVAEPIAGTISADTSVCLGQGTTVNVTSSFGAIQWERSTNNVTWHAITGATATSYSPTAHTVTTYYRAIASNGSCTPVTSATSTITLKDVSTSSAAASLYATNWTDGQDDTRPGLGPWIMSPSTNNAFAGFFIGSSNLNDAGTPSLPNINTSSRAWGMYSNTSNTASAVRAITNTLYIGQSISFSLDSGSIKNGGTVGMGLQNASSENLMELYFVGGQSNYTLNDGTNTNTDTGVPFTRGGIEVVITLVSSSSYNITIIRKNDGSSYSFTSRSLKIPTNARVVSRIRFFSFNSGNNLDGGADVDYNTFVNNLSLSNPNITTQPSATAREYCLGATAAGLSVAASGTNLSYAWKSSTQNSTTLGTISGVLGTSASYTPDTTTAGSLWYFCVVTSDCGTSTSTVSGEYKINPLPTVVSSSSTSVTYDGGAKTSSATASAGSTIDFYDAATNGTLQGSAGTTTTTATPSRTTAGVYTFYAEARNLTSGCVSTDRTTVTLTIAKAASTISVTGATSFVYNAALQGPSTATVTGSTGLVTYSYEGVSPTTYDASNAKPKNVGDYTVTATVAADDNYLTANSGAISFSITPFGLTVSGTLTTSDKEYDTTDAATISGGSIAAQILGSDEVLLVQEGTFPSKNAGNNLAVTAAFRLIGGQALNYTLTQPNVPNASINKKEVTIINLATADKVYDKTNTAILSVVPATELQGEFPVDTANLSFTPSGYYASANVGNWTITSTTELTGSEKDNYILTQPEFTQKKDITPVGLTVTGITADNKVYDGNTDAVINTAGATLSGVLPGETAGVVLSTVSATGAFGTKDFGTGKTVTISGLSISGADSGNYSINSTVATTANIDRRPITITATSQTKCAGGAFSGSGDLNVGFTKNYNVAGDILSVTLTVIGNDGSLAGSYPIRPSLATPGASNYIINYVDGTLTVNQSPTATISGTVATCFGSSPQVTFTGANGAGTTGLGGTLQYEFTYKVGAGGTPTTITTVAGSATTFIVAPTTVVGAVDYILISVRDIVSGCSNASTPGTATVTTGICTQIRASQCGQFVPTIGTVIQANPVTGATQYRFEITLTTAPNTVTVYTWPNYYFNPTTVLGNGGLAYGKEYSIRVKPFIGATEYPYGGACIVKAPLAPPTPALTTTIRPTQCGKTLPQLSTVVQASPVSTATRYEFRVTDANGTRPIVSSTTNGFNILTGLVGGAVYDTDYFIEVQCFTGVGGVTPLTTWGAGCIVRTPSLPFSKLVTSQCNKTVTNLTSTLYASTVFLAEGYRFRVRLQSNPLSSRVVEKTSGNMSALTVAELSGGYAASTVYLVDVAVKYNGLWQEAYGGDVCTITTPTARMNTNSVESIFNVKAFPNPFASHFSLDIESSSDALVEMKVYDMIGRQLEAKQATVSELSTREIGRNYPSGVYNVIVSQGDKVKSIRMVKR